MNNDIITANFRKQFSDGPEIVADNLRIGAGITVFFGASGSGKTTMLRCLAGLETPDAGEINFGNQVWFQKTGKISLPPRKRGVGFVPQDYALFPHLTVWDNIGYGLKELTTTERTSRVAETLSWLGLTGLEHRRPQELSGGQQQRVALARAVVRRPKLLLLDEPLAALDTPTRLRLRGELRQLLRQLDIPTILVTHDRFEAIALGDQMVVMADGRNQQSGLVTDVFSRPVNLAVAEIIAVETIHSGNILERRDGLVTVVIGGTELTALEGDLPTNASKVYVCLRAEDVSLMRGDSVQTSPRNRLAATVKSVTREGPLVLVNLDCGFSLKALLTHVACDELALQPGMRLVALVKAPQVHLIPFANNN